MHTKQLLFVLLSFLLMVSAGKKDAAPSRFYCENGKATLKSVATLELIEATSQKLRGVIDPDNHTFAWSVELKSFQGFNSPLQREHFNENYMESTKFPKAKFNGKIENYNSSMLNGPVSDIKVTGILSVHGVDKTINISAKLGLEDGKLVGLSKFKVTPENYGIKIPSLVRDKIGKEMEVTVKADYAPFGQ